MAAFFSSLLSRVPSLSLATQSSKPITEEWVLVDSSREEEINLSSVKTPRQEESKECVTSSSSTCKNLSKITVIENAHDGIIQTILKLTDKIFVTGSCNRLKRWNHSGNLVESSTIPVGSNSQLTVTALSRLGETNWLSGTSDGYIYKWDQTGKNDCEVIFSLPQTRRNQQSLKCLFDLTLLSSTKKHTFIAGWSCGFSIHKEKLFEKSAAGKTDGKIQALCLLDKKHFLIATDSQLINYTTVRDDFSLWKSKILKIKEIYKKGCDQNPFISSITLLNPQDKCFGLSTSDGMVAVYDINAEKLIMQGEGHKGMVWKIENLSSSCFASCGEDGYINLWDIRQRNEAFFTIEDNEEIPSQTTVLLNMDENTLVSGSSPYEVEGGNGYSQLSLWDFRKLP